MFDDLTAIGWWVMQGVILIQVIVFFLNNRLLNRRIKILKKRVEELEKELEKPRQWNANNL